MSSFENKPLRDYDLVLAGRGDSRRFWAEGFLGVEQPRRSAEAWAMRDALASVLSNESGNGSEVVDMRHFGVAPRRAATCPLSGRR